MWHALLAICLSAHPLASDDAAERLAAVGKWSRSQKKPQLSVKEARALVDCVELPPVKETGCELPVKLCRLDEGDDGSSGTRIESLSLLLTGDERATKALRVWWTASYEPKRAECGPPGSAGHASCVARVEKDARDDAEEFQCDVVLINACRQEAYLTCRTRNLRQGLGQLERLHRFEF